MMSAALRISLETRKGDQCVKFEILDPKRAEKIGFGTFVKPEDVEITEAARFFWALKSYGVSVVYSTSVADSDARQQQWRCATGRNRCP